MTCSEPTSWYRTLQETDVRSIEGDMPCTGLSIPVVVEIYCVEFYIETLQSDKFS